MSNLDLNFIADISQPQQPPVNTAVQEAPVKTALQEEREAIPKPQGEPIPIETIKSKVLFPSFTPARITELSTNPSMIKDPELEELKKKPINRAEFIVIPKIRLPDPPADENKSETSSGQGSLSSSQPQSTVGATLNLLPPELQPTPDAQQPKTTAPAPSTPAMHPVFHTAAIKTAKAITEIEKQNNLVDPALKLTTDEIQSFSTFMKDSEANPDKTKITVPEVLFKAAHEKLLKWPDATAIFCFDLMRIIALSQNTNSLYQNHTTFLNKYIDALNARTLCESPQQLCLFFGLCGICNLLCHQSTSVSLVPLRSKILSACLKTPTKPMFIHAVALSIWNLVCASVTSNTSLASDVTQIWTLAERLLKDPQTKSEDVSFVVRALLHLSRDKESLQNLPKAAIISTLESRLPKETEPDLKEAMTETITNLKA
ncbi:hypothetical protein BLNAU_6414 [Blattamonas nauphoetae]|uniref:PUL domain-containing protein n=1 Tax=Blattamonas nauphoetae TaxID=2049346 RepID=A0ABQ9Y4H3_9EUKA|nr:hypothetical protein BLNAU_6414 [Blattamonas nauphoetae]